MSTSRTFHGSTILKEAITKLEMRLDMLIAETAHWAHPDTHHRQIRETGLAAVYPKSRRAKKGEKRDRKAGLDDNTKANRLIKRAIGSRVVGFECCHVWPKSCYDPRYHTAIPNLVLIPRALASLTDYDPGVQAALQYRAYELYIWHPDEQPIPEKPMNYPENWREPEPDPKAFGFRKTGKAGTHLVKSEAGSADGPASTDKIHRWASKRGSNVHRIIATALHYGPLSRTELVQNIERQKFSSDPSGAIRSLMSNTGKNYGRVFVERSGMISIHPEIEEVIHKYDWRSE